jgi:hypothetical protein
MIHLRPVISVREIPPIAAKLRAALPSIRSLVRHSPNEDEENCVRYLQQGVFGCWFPCPRLADDVLQPGLRINLTEFPGLADSGPACVLTDGCWVWPAVLVYYVARYHLQLTPDFVEQARANQWTVWPERFSIFDLCWDAFDSAPPESTE